MQENQTICKFNACLGQRVQQFIYLFWRSENSGLDLYFLWSDFTYQSNYFTLLVMSPLLVIYVVATEEKVYQVHLEGKILNQLC